MELCADCRRKVCPYLLVAFLSPAVGFVTWLTLSAARIPPDAIRWWTGGVVLVFGGILFGYLLNCMRRHCQSDGHTT
jgi:hypothetical protein